MHGFATFTVMAYFCEVGVPEIIVPMLMMEVSCCYVPWCYFRQRGITVSSYRILTQNHTDIDHQPMPNESDVFRGSYGDNQHLGLCGQLFCLPNNLVSVFVVGDLFHHMGAPRQPRESSLSSLAFQIRHLCIWHVLQLPQHFLVLQDSYKIPSET